MQCATLYTLRYAMSNCPAPWSGPGLANKLNIIHGRKRLDVGYILYVLQALGYPLKLAGENARIWDHLFLWMVRVVDFFQLFFSSRVVGGLG